MRVHLPLAFLAASMPALLTSTGDAADEIVVLSAGGAHRTVVLVIDGPGGAEVALEEAAKGLDVSFSRAGRDAKVTLRSGGREVTLENGKSLFSVAGQLRALAAPVRVVGERTYVSAPSAAIVLGAALGQTATYRTAYRALVIGAYDAPRLRLVNLVSVASVESTIELSKPVPYEIRKEPNRVVVIFQADVMETDFVAEALPGRIVVSARFERASPPRLTFDLGDRFGSVKTSERDSQHVGLLFDTPPIAGAWPVPGGPEGPTGRPAPGKSVALGTGFQKPIVLVIDPGHGGDDGGARGPGGKLEKDVTLALARRLRAAAVDSLSVQAYLTRDNDMEVPLDERAAIANNFNADIFISLHANGSRAASAKGTEVFFLSYTAADDEARRIAMQEGEITERTRGNDKDVGLILWDMAQAAQLEASSRLAGNIHGEIAEAALSRSRGVKQAPFRVLVGATMPAALVEVGFITNPEEEKLLFSEAHQVRLTNALVQGLGRFIAALRANP
ncbi:MAG: N-acetylmuramoyl-L-alanine amidase [Vicinamibacteria bacterium]|nr:N-acetylmuramoyl-L-alanine amidase [Vicinamibacteria bacterium]